MRREGGGGRRRKRYEGWKRGLEKRGLRKTQFGSGWKKNLARRYYLVLRGFTATLCIYCTVSRNEEQRLYCALPFLSTLEKIETNISDILFNFSGMGIIEGEKFLQKFGKIYCTVQPFTVVIFFESSWQLDRTIGAISTTRFRFWTGLYVQIHPLQYFLSGNILTRAMSCPGIISVRRTVPVLDSRGITKNIN